MHSKQLPFELVELKADDGRMQFSGWASAYGIRDHQNDVVMRGAFDATLASGFKRRLLWQHDQREPIGVEQELRSDDKGLFGTWRLSKTTRGLDAYELLKDGAVDSLSIGYIPTEYEYDDGGTRLLKAVELLEVSLVSIPALDEAVVTQVKSDQPLDLLARQVIANIQLFGGAAKALRERRTSEGRKLSERHLEAVREFLSHCAAQDDELAAILAEAKADATAPEPEAKADGGDSVSSATEEAVAAPSAPSADLSIRLALARARLRRIGILERAS